MSRNDEVDETARRRQHDGTYQIVWMSELTGAALPFEGGLTIDDVERWVDEIVVKDKQQ